MESKESSKSFKEHLKELELVSIRIEARMAELERIITDLSKNLQ